MPGRASSSPMPLYHQVSSVLRQRMISGDYEAGRKLPTEDELIAEFGVSKATVRQAVGELVASGLVSREQGGGTFVLQARRETSVRCSGERWPASCRRPSG